MGEKTGEALSNLGAAFLGFGANLNKKTESAKSSIRKYLIGAQVPEELNRIYEQAAKNPDPKAGFEEFQNSFVGFAKGFMQAIPEVEDQLYARHLLAHTAQGIEGRFKNEIEKQNTNIAKLQIAEAIDKYQELALFAAESGDLNGAMAHQATITKLIFDGVKKGYIPSSSAHLTQKQLGEEIRTKHYAYHIGKFVEASDIKALESLKEDIINDKKLSHRSKTSLLTYFSNTQGKKQLLLGLGEESFQDFKKEVVFQAKNHGKALGAGEIQYLASLKPKQAMEIRHGVDDGVEVYNAVTQQKLLPLGKKVDYLRQLDEQITNARSAREQNIYKEAKELTEQEIDLAFKDPVALVNSINDTTKIIDEELKNFQNTPAFQKLPEGVKAEALKQRKATLMLEQQKALGLEPRLLSNKNAEAIVTKLKGMGFGNSLPQLRGVLAAYGSHADMVLKDLEKAGLPMGLKYTLKADPNYQPTLVKAFNASPKELKTLAAIGEEGDYKNQAIKSKIQKKIHDYVNTLPAKETLELEQAVYTAVLQELAEGNKESNAINNAVKGIYEYKYQTIANGYRIPKLDQNKQKIKSSAVHNKARHLSAKIPELLDSLSFSSFSVNQKLSKTQQAKMILDGKWRTMPNDKGLIYVASNGSQVKTKEGFNLAFYFSDLKKDQEAKAQGIKDKLLNVFE